MRKIYVLWNAEKEMYVGNYGQPTDFANARLFNRKSDATNSRNHNWRTKGVVSPVAVTVGGESPLEDAVNVVVPVGEISSLIPDLEKYVPLEHNVILVIQKDDYSNLLDGLAGSITNPEQREIGEALVARTKAQVGIA